MPYVMALPLRCKKCFHSTPNVCKRPITSGVPRRRDVDGSRGLVTLCGQLGMHRLTAQVVRRSLFASMKTLPQRLRSPISSVALQTSWLD